MREVTSAEIWKAFEKAPQIDVATIELYESGYCDDLPEYSRVVKQGRVLDICDDLLTNEYFIWMTDLVHINTAPCILDRIVTLKSLASNSVDTYLACPSWYRAATRYIDVMGNIGIKHPDEDVFHFFDFDQLEVYLHALVGFDVVLGSTRRYIRFEDTMIGYNALVDRVQFLMKK